MGRTLIILVFDQIVFCFNSGLTFSLVIEDMCVDLSLTPGYLFCISRLLWGIPQGGRGMFWDKDQTALLLHSIFYIDFDLKVKAVNNCAIIYFVWEKRFCLQLLGQSNSTELHCSISIEKQNSASRIDGSKTFLWHPVYVEVLLLNSLRHLQELRLNYFGLCLLSSDASWSAK